MQKNITLRELFTTVSLFNFIVIIGQMLNQGVQFQNYLLLRELVSAALPLCIYQQLASYVMLMIGLTLILSLIVAGTGSLLARTFTWNRQAALSRTLYYATVFQLFIILLNAQLFMNSRMSILTYGIISYEHVIYTLAIVGIILVSFTLIALYELSRIVFAATQRRMEITEIQSLETPIAIPITMTFISILTVTLSIIYLTSSTQISSLFSSQRSQTNIVVSNQTANHHNKPNIILIGLDGVRTDALSDAPYLSNFFQHATTFNHAITPVARTFVAWTSLLTGQYPEHHGAREDLIPERYYDTRHSIGHFLQKQGYETFFALDDIRFADINNQFGFDHIISSKPGFNNVLIAAMSDAPLMNLMVNTRLGHQVLPFLYNNRGAFITYDPHQFVNDITVSLRKTQKPIFLAAHFCLAHHPYYLKNKPGVKITTNAELESAYHVSMKALDEQFAEIINKLKQSGLLENSLIIVFSDHGEGLGLKGDRLLDPTQMIGTALPPSLLNKLYQPNLMTYQDYSWSHGTDALSPSQYHHLLALQEFKQGKTMQPSISVNQNVSLVDIGSTVHDYLKDAKFNGDGDGDGDGVSLLKHTHKRHRDSAKNITDNSRYIFHSSGYTPPELLKNSKLDPAVLITLFSRVYDVTPNGLMRLKPSIIDNEINREKQFSVFYDHWQYCLYPIDKTWIHILVDLNTKQWTTDMNSSLAKNSPWKAMDTQLQTFNKREIHNEHTSRV